MPLADFLWLCAAGVCGAVCVFASCWTFAHPQLGLLDLAALAGFGWCMERGERQAGTGDLLDDIEEAA